MTSITRRSPRELGAEGDEEAQLIVDGDMRTSVPGLYAAGCVTPANCQMIIAAGQGATAAQAIDHDLFNEYWRSRTLPRIERTGPEILRSGALKWMA